MYIHPSRGKEKRTQNYIIIELQSYRTTRLQNISFTLFALPALITAIIIIPANHYNSWVLFLQLLLLEL